MNFIAHPLTGDLLNKYDDDAVKRSIRQLVSLGSFEKPFHPEIAGSVRELLFEPIGRNTAIGIESRIEFLIKQFESRADLISIEVDPNITEDGYDITIRFRVINQLEPVVQRIFLQRVR